jgi:hypothetical protein
MKIKVEACWGGGQRHFFRVTLPKSAGFRNDAHEFVSGDAWNRATAKEALDLLQNVYHIPRHNVRFDVR